MAIYTKPIPTLRGKAAQRFMERAHLNETTRKHSIDFSKEIKEMREVLKRSNFNS